MSALADLVETQRDALLEIWVARTRVDSGLESASDDQVRSFIPRFVREVTLAVRARTSPTASPAAQEHAQQRRGIGVSQEAIVRELCGLRAIVLEIADASAIPIECDDLRVLDSCVFVAIGEVAAVLALDAIKDSLAQADMGRMLGRVREAEQHALLAQQVAQSSAQQLRVIADALPVLISWVGADETYVFVNKTYEAWFKRPRESVVGRPAIEIIGAAAYAVMKVHIHRALSGERFTFVQHAVPYPDTTRDVRASFIPQLDQAGRVDGFVVLMEDLAGRVVG